MKTYILTEYERKLIKAYLEKYTTSGQLRTLKKRAKESVHQLDEDLRLIKKYLMHEGFFFDDEYTPIEILRERELDARARAKITESGEVSD